MKHVPLEFWARFNRDVAKSARPGFMLLGELLDGRQSAVAKTWRAGGFTSMFDFPLSFALNDVFCRGEPPSRLATALTDGAYPDAANIVTLADNHDLPRLMTTCGGDVAKVSQALAFLLTARGVPSLTWGTEAGFTGEKDPANRASMNFAQHPLYAEISQWLTLRSKTPALSEGDTRVLALEEGRVLFARRAESQLALVFVNQKGPWAPALPPAWAKVAWRDARGESVERVQPGVTVWLSPLEAGLGARFGLGDVAAQHALTLRGPAGAIAVGSDAALGEWDPGRGLALPASLRVSEGSVLEFKLVRKKADGSWAWEPGKNRALLVGERDEAVDLDAGPVWSQ